jgi:hypothetical protein
MTAMRDDSNANYIVEMTASDRIVQTIADEAVEIPFVTNSNQLATTKNLLIKTINNYN